jgi:hypothetical protein
MGRGARREMQGGRTPCAEKKDAASCSPATGADMALMAAATTQTGHPTWRRRAPRTGGMSAMGSRASRRGWPRGGRGGAELACCKDAESERLSAGRCFGAPEEGTPGHGREHGGHGAPAGDPWSSCAGCCCRRRIPARGRRRRGEKEVAARENRGVGMENSQVSTPTYRRWLGLGFP